ncbi:MAG: DNA-processing protein DprA [Ktedonobacteraceae bacterium]
MERNLQEEACWLLLAFESNLSTRIVNSIIAIWCKQLGRTLHEFFASASQEWIATCHLNQEIVTKLEQAKEKLVGQVFFAEQLQNEQIHLITVLDLAYPQLLKSALSLSQIPCILFSRGDLGILKRQTIAVIGSRKANETSLSFTRSIAQKLAELDANIISGNARGVDRTAYEGATSMENGHTTVVLPHGIRKLSRVQMRDLQPKIEGGHVLVMSQFHPDAGWLVSRAMERNKVVTGLAQVVVVAEAGTKGGTWEGAQSAIKQKRPLYVRQSTSSLSLPGNEALIKLGGQPLPWPTGDVEEVFAPLLVESAAQQQKQHEQPARTEQFSLFVAEE